MPNIKASPKTNCQFRRPKIEARYRVVWRRQLGQLALVALMLASACSASIERSAPTAPLKPSPVSVLAVVTASSLSGPTPTASRFPSTALPISTPDRSPTALLGDLPTSAAQTGVPTRFVSSAAQIDYFRSEPGRAGPGEFVTLSWSIKGVESATIYRLDTQARRGASWYVSRTGTLRVRLQSDGEVQEQFQLVVGDGPDQLTRTIGINLTCSQAWFFKPEPSGCAPGTPVNSIMVEQAFERGWMYWIQAEKRIYVIFSDKQKPGWAYFPDDYKDNQPESDANLKPPQGFFQPVRGFGLVWRTKTGLRARLGWASASEQAYEGVAQGDATLENGTLYMRTRDKNVLQLANTNAEWQLIVPQR